MVLTADQRELLKVFAGRPEVAVVPADGLRGRCRELTDLGLLRSVLLLQGGSSLSDRMKLVPALEVTNEGRKAAMEVPRAD